MTTETLSVPDISCDHCQRTIESALGGLPGVRAAAAIRATLAEEGYEVAG